MKIRQYDHIDLRVKDRAVAQRFYEKVLPALGFSRDQSGDEWGAFESGNGDRPTEFFGFKEDRNHQPGETRIAFWAESREEVDRIAEVVRQAGGRNLEGPELCLEYSPGYYAFFFEDPCGNKLEVCCRERSIVAD